MLSHNFKTAFPNLIKENVSLKDMTTIKIGGTAELVFYPENHIQIKQFIVLLKKLEIPYIVLGGGSNSIFNDRTYNTPVIVSSNLRTNLKINSNYVRVSAGYTLSEVIKKTMSANLSGLEYFAGIPGTIGGAAAGNAGSFGKSISDFIEGIATVNDNGLHYYDRNDIEFKYRSTNIPKDEIIYEIDLKLEKSSIDIVEQSYSDFLEKKKKSQPINLKTAGCVFKNKEGVSAGYLIDKNNLKGKAQGDIKISELHANYFVNTGKGKFSDFIILAEEVKKEIKRKENIELEIEVKVFE